MELPPIYMNMNQDLIRALAEDGLDPATYGPAYDGESVAIDLYNASPRAFVVPRTAAATDDPEEYKNVFKRLMPTGMRLAIPRGWGGFIFERGSITKTPLAKRAGVIDPGYRDEVFVNAVDLHPNVNYRVEPYAKSPFQMVFLLTNTNIVQVASAKFDELHSDSKRKDGKIGSSD